MVPGPVYITQDPGRAIFTLSDIDAGLLLGRIPSSRSSATLGYFPTRGGRRWAVTEPDVQSQISDFPFWTSIDFVVRAVLLATLVGRGHHVVNYLE
jgi:hypothetical protein